MQIIAGKKTRFIQGYGFISVCILTIFFSLSLLFYEYKFYNTYIAHNSLVYQIIG